MSRWGETRPASSEPLLTVVTVNHNSSQFVELLLDSLEALTYHGFRVRIVDNDSHAADYGHLMRAVERHPAAMLERRRGLDTLGSLVPAGIGFAARSRLRALRAFSGNLAHGTALNDLLRGIDTRYGLILDADCVPLRKHWDVAMIERLRSTGAAVLGASSLDEPFSPFPSVRCLFFRAPVLQALGVDFRPLKSLYLDRNPTLKRELRRRFLAFSSDPESVPLDEREAFLDVGWHVVKRCREHGVKWELLETRPADGRFARHPGTEVILDRGELVAAHFVRGSWPLAWKRRPRSAALRLLYLSTLLLPVLRRRREREEKAAWRACCRAVIRREVRSATARGIHADVPFAVGSRAG